MTGRPASAARLIVADLDCEIAWTRAARPASPAPPLAPAARARAADAAAWLAAFGQPGDRLWLPGPPSAAARAAAAGFGVVVESGPLADLAPAAAVLAWGETAEVAALRARGPGPGPGSPPAIDEATTTSGPAAGDSAEVASPAAPLVLHRDLWAIPAVAPAVAVAAADRRLGAAVAARLGCLLPGARPIDSVAGLERHLAAGGAAAGGGAFVLKPPHAAAGRDRLRHRGALDAGARARCARLLDRFGELGFEPWLDRVDDLGQGGVIRAGRIELLPPHRTEVDDRGVFRAAIVDDDTAWLAPADRVALAAAATAAAAALSAVGYRGPFAIDAFHHRDVDGTVRLHPLCEINARLSFGLVARAHAERSGRGRFALSA